VFAQKNVVLLGCGFFSSFVFIPLFNKGWPRILWKI